MDASTALTTALHHIRAKKPELQIAEETGIAPSMLTKYRSGHARPHVDEWPKIVRAIHEVDPAQAAIVARAAIPPELFGLIAVASDSSPLAYEVLEAGAAHGNLAKTYLEAARDGQLCQQELDEIETAYQELQDETLQGLAAIEKIRKSRERDA